MLSAVVLGALAAAPPCAPDNGGLTLPPGVCASVAASGIGPVRHMVVAPNGDLFVAVAGREVGVLALRDTDGDGHYETRRQFGPSGGNGIALTADYLYFAPNEMVVRWRWRTGQLEPEGPPEVVVRDLPSGGNSGKTIAIGPDGMLYVNVASKSNACQEKDRFPMSRGKVPCLELQTRAGIWRFRTDRVGQTVADGERFATGVRNAMALAFHPGTGALYAAIHGRDQFNYVWGWSHERNAELPAEELVEIRRGGDYGWPFCYYDPHLRRQVLAPEYGGDGERPGRCATIADPLVAFPAHWGPMALTFASGTALPPEWRDGAFVAFHGSWNRAPLPEAGYRVAFVPFRDGRPTGESRDFATPTASPTGMRAAGVAVGPDGSLFIAADREATIWRVTGVR